MFLFIQIKILNKTMVESVQLEKTLELICGSKFWCNFFLAFCHNFFLQKNDVKKMFQLKDFVKKKKNMVSNIVQPAKILITKRKYRVNLGGGQGCRVNIGRALFNDLDQFVYPPYQILASYDAQNLLKSLLWWVVGGWLRPILVLSLSLKLNKN